jgi:NAD(P)-dependent dehydrogenase (short-subunit alcohol dehydrogenase family)
MFLERNKEQDAAPWSGYNRIRGDRMGKKAVVVTGASTGIGRACSLYLIERGFRVLAGVRQQADAEKLLEDAANDLVPLFMDVTQAESLAEAAGKARELIDDGGLSGLVNNAGISITGPLEFLPIEDLRQQLEVNVIGQVATTQSFLPLLREGNGRIVNIGSLSGRTASPMLGPYAMSKFALAAFNDSLRRELHRWGIQVCLIEPGAIATPIWEKSIERAEIRFGQLEAEAQRLYAPIIESVRAAAVKMSETAIPVEEVAEVVHHALTAHRPRTRYLVGPDAKWMARLIWLFPDRALDWLTRKRFGMLSNS